MNRPLIITTLTIGLLSFLIAGCQPPQPMITGSGIVEAVDVAILPELPGKITAMPVKEGSRVQSGDLLAELDTTLLQLERQVLAVSLEEIHAAEIQAKAGVAQAQAAVDGTEKAFNRAKILKARGSIPDARFDEAETAFDMAVKQRDTARSVLKGFPPKRASIQARTAVIDHKISLGIITAPRDGTIVETYLESGEMAMPGRPLMKLADLSRLEIKIYLPGPDIGKVKRGAGAKIQVDSHPAQLFTGSVTWISDTAEFTPKNIQTREARADLVYAVKISVENPHGIFKTGMPVDVCLEGFPEYLSPFETR